MKWLGLIVLAAVNAACVAVFPSATPRAGELSRPGDVVLTVVTWNMGAGSGDLAALLDAHVASPFVALLQECDAAPLAELATARGLSVFHAPVQPGAPNGGGNAIVSTLPLRSARLIPLPRERQPRTAVAASIEVAGVRLFVVSTHLENRVSWWQGGLLSEEARGRQAEALLAALPDDAPVFLAATSIPGSAYGNRRGSCCSGGFRTPPTSGRAPHFS